MASTTLERPQRAAEAEVPQNLKKTTPTLDEGTVCPQVPDLPDGERVDVKARPLSERMDLAGGLIGGIALAGLLFGWVTPFQGGIGFVVVAFALFLGLYVLLVRLGSSAQEATDRVVTVLMVSAGVVLFGALSFIVLFTLVRAINPLSHLNFFVETMQSAGPLDPLTVGGIRHAIIGTLIQIGIAIAISVPLGIATAVFLNEVGGKFARFVRTVADAMTALPSVVAGLFIYAAFIQGISHERSGFAASLAITVMMLPIIIRSADVVLRLVPGNLREAAYAMGSTRWKTVWNVVLPTARSGLVTAVILGTARGIGETSPVLLTSGMSGNQNLNPFSGPMISLPLQVFAFTASPEPLTVARGFGTAAVLLVIVLVLFMAARFFGGRAPGDLSDRQVRAARAASQKTARRFETASRPKQATPPLALQQPASRPAAGPSRSADTQLPTEVN